MFRNEYNLNVFKYLLNLTISPMKYAEFSNGKAMGNKQFLMNGVRVLVNQTFSS